MSEGIEVLAKPPGGGEAILSGEALGFVERLHREFQPRRRELLDRRAKRQAEFDAGALPDFLPETRSVRSGSWSLPLPGVRGIS